MHKSKWLRLDDFGQATKFSYMVGAWLKKKSCTFSLDAGFHAMRTVYIYIYIYIYIVSCSIIHVLGSAPQSIWKIDTPGPICTIRIVASNETDCYFEPFEAPANYRCAKFRQAIRCWTQVQDRWLLVGLSWCYRAYAGVMEAIAWKVMFAELRAVLIDGSQRPGSVPGLSDCGPWRVWPGPGPWMHFCTSPTNPSLC